MKYFVAASLLAATVSAAGIADLPPCSVQCAISELGKQESAFKSSCDGFVPTISNIMEEKAQQCLCKTTAFQTAFADCAKASGCSTDDQCKLWNVSKETCDGFKIPLSDSLEPAVCKAAGGGGSSAPPANTSAPPANTSAPPAETTGAPPAETTGAPPAETSAPAETSGSAGAPPSYGSPSTVATAASSAAAGASGAPSTSPTYTPSSASTMVLSGAAAFFAGLVAILAL